MLRWYISKAFILRSLKKCYRLEQQQFAWRMIWCTIWLKSMIQGWAEIPVALCDFWEFPRIMKRDGNSRLPLSWCSTTICQKDDLVHNLAKKEWSATTICMKDDLVHNLLKRWSGTLASRRSSALFGKKGWFGTRVCIKSWSDTTTCQKDDLIQYFANKTI